MPVFRINYLTFFLVFMHCLSVGGLGYIMAAAVACAALGLGMQTESLYRKVKEKEHD